MFTLTTTHEQPTTFLAFPSESILQSCNRDNNRQCLLELGELQAVQQGGDHAQQIKA